MSRIDKLRKSLLKTEEIRSELWGFLLVSLAIEMEKKKVKVAERLAFCNWDVLFTKTNFVLCFKSVLILMRI